MNGRYRELRPAPPERSQRGDLPGPGGACRSDVHTTRVRWLTEGVQRFRSWNFTYGDLLLVNVVDLYCSALYLLGVKLRGQATAALDTARETLTDVQTASRKVVETTEWATVALVCVSAVSLLALGIATAAYIRVGQRGAE